MKYAIDYRHKTETDIKVRKVEIYKGRRDRVNIVKI